MLDHVILAHNDAEDRVESTSLRESGMVVLGRKTSCLAGRVRFDAPISCSPVMRAVRMNARPRLA